MKRWALLAAAAFAALMSFDRQDAKAYWGPFGGYYSNYYYDIYIRESPPYFTLNPPVYYSYPVPRTYGYSPYPYPPGTVTPRVAERSEPALVTNPYVLTTDSELVTTPSPRPKPLRITNPYVEQ